MNFGAENFSNWFEDINFEKLHIYQILCHDLNYITRSWNLNLNYIHTCSSNLGTPVKIDQFQKLYVFIYFIIDAILFSNIPISHTGGYGMQMLAITDKCGSSYLSAYNCKWVYLSRYIEDRSFRRFVESCLEETIVVYVDHLLSQVCRTPLGTIQNNCILVIWRDGGNIYNDV